MDNKSNKNLSCCIIVDFSSVDVCSWDNTQRRHTKQLMCIFVSKHINAPGSTFGLKGELAYVSWTELNDDAVRDFVFNHRIINHYLKYELRIVETVLITYGNVERSYLSGKIQLRNSSFWGSIDCHSLG